MQAHWPVIDISRVHEKVVVRNHTLEVYRDSPGGIQYEQSSQPILERRIEWPHVFALSRLLTSIHGLHQSIKFSLAIW